MVLQTLHLPLALRAKSPVRLVADRRHVQHEGARRSRSWTPPGGGTWPRWGCRWRWRCRPPGSTPAGAAGWRPGSSRASPGRWRSTTAGPLQTHHRASPGWRTCGAATIAERMRRRAEHALAAARPRAGRRDRGRAGRVDRTRPGSGPRAWWPSMSTSTPRSSAWVRAASRPRRWPTRPSPSCSPTSGTPGAVDPHSADQLLLPLALAEGRSAYTVTEVTEHLRTNAATIRSLPRSRNPHRGTGRRLPRPRRRGVITAPRIRPSRVRTDRDQATTQRPTTSERSLGMERGHPSTCPRRPQPRRGRGSNSRTDGQERMKHDRTP